MKSPKTKPRYSLEGQRMNRQAHRTELMILDRLTKKEFSLNPAEVLNQQNMIEKFTAVDAMRIGFIAGLETMQAAERDIQMFQTA